MNRTIFIGAFFGGIAPVLWAVEAPGARSPIGSPTQVPSAERTAAIPSPPNLYGYVGNLTMTGNIGGGRHFRGFVPYSSSDYIDRRLLDPQSRAVSAFMRRSALAEPFYDPRQTVASLHRTGGSGLAAPAVPSQVRSASSKEWLESFDITEILRPPNQRPLAPSTQTLESIFQQHLAQKAEEKKALPSDPFQTVPLGMDLSKTTPESQPTPVQTPPNPSLKEPAEPQSIYAQIRRQLGFAEEKELPEKDSPPIDEPLAPKEQASERPPFVRSKLLLRPEDFVDPAEGRAVLKTHPDFEHLASAKSEDYSQLGEQFLKSGQYYKAADAFELASVWDRRNPFLVLARSHALFSAGEYMSSAFYLSQAIEMEPKVLLSRLDWPSLLESRDVFENRLTELSTWQQRSNSPELALLMGYMLFQDNKLTRAQISAEYARDMMPDSEAAKLLLETIRSSSAASADP